jgi:hypothetical protein
MPMNSVTMVSVENAQIDGTERSPELAESFKVAQAQHHFWIVEEHGDELKQCPEGERDDACRAYSRGAREKHCDAHRPPSWQDGGYGKDGLTSSRLSGKTVRDFVKPVDTVRAKEKNAKPFVRFHAQTPDMPLCCFRALDVKGR